MIAEDDDEASKTEEPSERKISKAKEEGDIAISQDAKSFIMLPVSYTHPDAADE